ncbi:ubiquitin-conjugating enzyme E2 G1 [Protopterus annectens]|uniref:ubiquitin-conjugating enzyme E2 G1 n=1 Tax=Protopterus annectens TaxID=7888 RepID=UPI001CFA14AA|nr:ubiquitin-conjugating enzyme E2 G1 [Protopterus annectens]
MAAVLTLLKTNTTFLVRHNDVEKNNSTKNKKGYPKGEGGVFKAHLTFPKDYPLKPPKLKFITEIWHPNVDKNGDVCISILHEPGEDKYGYEKPEERWLPIHTVETIMISVISMLADPNGDSPANVDAAKEWREDRNGEFKRKVARCVRKSQETAFE